MGANSGWQRANCDVGADAEIYEINDADGAIAGVGDVGEKFCAGGSAEERGRT